MLLSERAAPPYSMFPLLKHRAPCTIYGTSYKPFIKYRIIHFLMGFSIGSSGQHPNASQILTDVSSEQPAEDGKRWGPEGGKLGQVTEVLEDEDWDKSWRVSRVQGEIRETRCFQSWNYWHFLAQGPAPTPPGRWGPSTPATQSTTNLLDLHKTSSMAEAGPRVHPAASCRRATPPFLQFTALFTQCFADQSRKGAWGPMALSSQLLLVMLLAAAHSLGCGFGPLWTSLLLALFILMEDSLSQTWL